MPKVSIWITREELYEVPVFLPEGVSSVGELSEDQKKVLFERAKRTREYDEARYYRQGKTTSCEFETNEDPPTKPLGKGWQS